MWINIIAAALAGNLDQLASQDPVSCASLGPADDALFAGPVAVARPDVTPSIVPMRAAQCLLALYPDRADLDAVIVPWMRTPATYGFALLVAGQIDALPLPLALTVTGSGREMSDPVLRQRILERISRSSMAEVRAAAIRQGALQMSCPCSSADVQSRWAISPPAEPFSRDDGMMVTRRTTPVVTGADGAARYTLWPVTFAFTGGVRPIRPKQR